MIPFYDIDRSMFALASNLFNAVSTSRKDQLVFAYKNDLIDSTFEAIAKDTRVSKRVLTGGFR